MSSSNIAHPEQRTELTERQEAVLRLIAKGMTNAEIAEQLGVTLDGVKWHVREILGKFQVDSREEAAQRWREQNSTGNRIRSWAGGLVASSAVRWASGLAAIGGTGLIGTAALVNTMQAGEQEPEAPPAAVVAVATPDPATSDGLTLKIEKVITDDTLTTLEFTLEGRPELGRLGGPAFGLGPNMPTLTDQDGTTYRSQSMGGEAGRERFQRMTFGPVPEGTTSLTFRLGDAAFVAPAFEVPEGQRPPDPSATVAGPWTKTIVEILRLPVVSVPVDHAPQAFGKGSIVIDEVLQTATETVIRGRLTVRPAEQHYWYRPNGALTNTAGTFATLTSGRWGDGPAEELMEFRFERLTGVATFTLTGMRGLTLSEADIEANITAQNMSATDAADFRARMAAENEGSALVETYFAGQPPAIWTITLP